MAKAPLIENYPGYSGSGSHLADAMFEPIEQDVDFFFGDVQQVFYEKDHYVVKTNLTTLEGKTLIWATGCEHMKLGVPGENDSNVHYCITCDGPLYTDKDITIIGDGNSALQYVCDAVKYASHVRILTLFNKFYGEPRWVSRVDDLIKTGVVEWIPNWRTSKIDHDGDQVIIYDDSNCSVATDGVFVAIGQKPNNFAVSHFVFVHMDEKGFIINSSENEDMGFYAVGDCRQKPFRQVSLACADGVEAALKINKYLER